MGVARWAVLWAALILFSCVPALAQQYRADDGGGASQGQYELRRGEERVTCVGAVEVARVGPETEGTVTPFRTTGRTFVVTYDVAFEGGDGFGSVSVDVEDRSGGLVEFQIVGENDDGSGSYVVTEGAGAYDLVVDVQQTENATYTVVVEDCRGTQGDGGGDGQDDGDGQGDVDDPDDVMTGTGDDGPLPNTGGVPLLFGAAALVLAAALVSRRILAP